MQGERSEEKGPGNKCALYHFYAPDEGGRVNSAPLHVFGEVRLAAAVLHPLVARCQDVEGRYAQALLLWLWPLLLLLHGC